MAVQTTLVNKPFSPRGNDQSPLAYNRAKLFSGKALDFDGVNDSVSVADSDDLDGFTNFTYSVIAKAESTPNYCRLLDKGLDTILGAFNLSGQFYLYANSTAIQFDYVLKLNEYLHFAIVFTGGVDVKLYINGVLEETKTHSIASTGTNSTNLAIGSNNALNGNVWDGHISNARLFNTALTAAQVADLYNNPEKVVPTGVDNTALKLWLPMQEGAGTTAYDGSGNGNHGTISGATYTHGIGAPVAQTAVIDWNKGKNSFTYSEDFSNADWTNQDPSVPVTPNDTTAPDGSQTADKIETGTSSQLIYQTPSLTANEPFVLSVFAKAGNWDIIRLGHFSSSSNGAWFNLTSGTAGAINGGALEIQDFGNGWYRLIAKFSSFTASSFSFFGVSLADGSTATPSSGSYLYLWGASIYEGTTADPYIPTLSTAQTSPVLLPQGLTTGRDITGVNLFENVRKQGALNLDGNSWAEVHDNESLDFGTGSFSLEVWSKAKYISSGSIYNVLLTLGNNVSSGSTSSLYIDSSLNYTFRYDSTLIVASGSSEGDWSHVVGVYDGTNINIYLNGSFVVQAAASATSKTNTYSKRIGTDTAGASRTYKDQIAQPRIYNRALTAEEVARNYNNAKSIYTNS